MSKFKKWNPTVEIGLFSGSATFFSTLLLVMYWHRDGFDELELILMSIIAGVFLFFFTLLFNYVLLKPSLIKKREKNEPIPKRRYLLLIILIVSLISYLVMDYFLFLVNKSISVDYLSFLNSLDENTDNHLKDVYPFAFLNSIVTLIFGFLSALFSLSFMKKNI